MSYGLKIFILIFFIQSYAIAKEIDPAPQNYLERLSEGQQLLFRPRVGGIIYDDDISAVKNNGKIYYSLTDIIDVLNLAIDFDDAKKTGKGWFLREDWDISLDFQTKRITSRNLTFVVNDDNFIEQDNRIYLAQKSIEEWLDFQITEDIPQQYIEIKTPHPLPLIAKNNRKKSKKLKRNRANQTIFPRIKNKYDWLDINTADIRLGSRFQRQDSNKKTVTKQSGVATLQGQLLKHNAYFSTSYDSQNNLSSITTRLSKRDENPILLGPLKARSYTIGDNNPVRIPLMGNAGQEFGGRLSNSTLRNNQFQTVILNGNAIPGWDAELYRNNILIDTQTITASSQYEFNDIQLFAGENKFEVFFYGPQGEIRYEKIDLPVTANLLDTQNDIYDISFSLADTQTYRKNKIDDADTGTLHLSGLYKKKLGNNLAYLGINTRQINKEQKTIIGAGTTSIVKETLIDTNLAADLSGEGAAQLTARKNINGWDISANGRLQTDNFKPNGEDTSKTLEINTNARKNFNLTNKSKLSIFTSNGYSQNNKDLSQISSEIGTSYFTNGINFSNNLNFNLFDGPQAQNTKTLNNNTAVRANIGDMFIRGGLSYNILPNAQIDRYFSQINYQPNSKFSGDITYNYRPQTNDSDIRFNLNHTNDYFRLSPFVEYDSNKNLYAGINLNFSIIDTPNTTLPKITKDRLIGKGMVSSFVYHDKNGNMIYDNNDEVLPEVVVKSINVKRRKKTNNDGYALINNLPADRATDITVDVNTLPDSFMITANDGVSVMPEAGEIIETQFPIHIAGEIDGTVNITKDGETHAVAKRAKIDLIPLDKKDKEVIQTQAAIDGFYVASQIPPGRYLMNVNDETIKRHGAGTPKPKIIEIGHDGDTFYGEDIKLDQDKPYMPIKISYVDTQSSTADNKATETFRLSTKSQGVSRLSSLLTDFAKQKADQSIYTGLQPVTLKTNGATQPNEIYTLNDSKIGSAYTQCQTLSLNGIPCAMEVIIPIAQ